MQSMPAALQSFAPSISFDASMPRGGRISTNATNFPAASLPPSTLLFRIGIFSSDFGRDAIEKARTIVGKARQAIQKRDVALVKEQIEGLTRTHRMFKGVVAKT